jgi:hypothetical protein
MVTVYRLLLLTIEDTFQLCTASRAVARRYEPCAVDGGWLHILRAHPHT